METKQIGLMRMMILKLCVGVFFVCGGVFFVCGGVTKGGEVEPAGRHLLSFITQPVCPHPK